jgi:hypothetical protein
MFRWAEQFWLSKVSEFELIMAGGAFNYHHMQSKPRHFEPPDRFSGRVVLVTGAAIGCLEATTSNWCERIIERTATRMATPMIRAMAR